MLIVLGICSALALAIVVINGEAWMMNLGLVPGNPDKFSWWQKYLWPPMLISFLVGMILSVT